MARSKSESGGTIVNIITALVLLGILGYGIMLLIKSFGEAGQQYTDTMVKTKYDAISVKCQMNLRTIGQNIQLYAVSNGRFPPSLQALVEWSGSTKLFQCPAPEGEQYEYIPGQGGNAPSGNILLFEPKAVHDGRCGVLRVGGKIELLTPEELQQAVTRTEAGLR